MSVLLLEELKEYSVVPRRFKAKDPRALLYHFPSLPIVKYAKLMQKYSFNQALEAAEGVAHYSGYLLLPSRCMHWQRVKNHFERRVKVGKHTFYLMRLKELTKSERQKLMYYIDDLSVDS